MIKLKRNQVAVEPIFDSDFYNPNSQLIKIPESSKDRCDQGTVKYIGAEIDPVITIGSHVIFSGYTGTTLKIDNEILIVMNYRYIKAVIEEDNKFIPGLYFKGRVNSDEILDSINYPKGDGIRQQMYKLLANYQNKIMIPADFNNTISMLNESHSIINVKPDERKEQRDEFDEGNL